MHWTCSPAFFCNSLCSSICIVLACLCCTAWAWLLDLRKLFEEGFGTVMEMLQYLDRWSWRTWGETEKLTRRILALENQVEEMQRVVRDLETALKKVEHGKNIGSSKNAKPKRKCRGVKKKGAIAGDGKWHVVLDGRPWWWLHGSCRPKAVLRAWCTACACCNFYHRAMHVMLEKWFAKLFHFASLLWILVAETKMILCFD